MSEFQPEHGYVNSQCIIDADCSTERRTPIKVGAVRRGLSY